MPYQPFIISLNAAVPETKLLDAGQLIGEIAVPAVPDGGELWLRIGKNPDFIQVTKPITFAPDNDNDANNGVTYKVVTPLAGAAVQVIVSWAGSLKTLLI